MARKGVIVAAFVGALLGLTAAASAQGVYRATFTRPIPASATAGERVAVVWTMRDSVGRPVSLERVFVKIVCPEGDVSTTTFATATGRGLYRAEAAVPAGGIGTVTIGAKGATIKVTNPFHS